MSDARVLLAALTALLAAPLAAQSDVEYLKRQHDLLSARRTAAAATLDSLRKAVTRVLDDSLVAAGRKVRFVGAQLDSADRATIVTTLESERARLAAEFGASAALLADNRPWDVEEYIVRRISAGYRVDYHSGFGARKYVLLERPVEPRPLEIVARATAAANASRLHPVTTRYVTEGATFDDSGDEQARAAENLALAGSATGRRCLQGSIADCRIVLGAASDETYLERFYDAEDWPALVRRQRQAPRNAPSTWTADRERCLEEGTTDACGPLVQFLPQRYPFGAAVRGTFFVDAVRAGGEAGLQRLVAARGAYEGDPLGLLAHVANVPEDSLVARWRSRIAERGRLASRDPIAPVVLTSLAWSGLLLLAGTLRRPR